MAAAILDTNVYIDHWERGLYQATLENLRRAYIIRHSAVVLSKNAMIRIASGKMSKTDFTVLLRKLPQPY